MKMLSQSDYWNKEAENFDAIYSHKKNKISVLLDKIFRKAMYDRFRYTIEQSEPITGKTFLDIGCGTGLFSIELARRGAKNVTGIDVAPRMIEICRSRAKEENLKHNTRFILGDIMDFDSDKSFDIIIGMGLLDYISEPLLVLNKMRKLTRKNVMLSFPILWSWRTIPRKIRLGLKKCSVYFYTRSKIRNLITKAGFKRLKIIKMGPMYFVISS